MPVTLHLWRRLMSCSGLSHHRRHHLHHLSPLPTVIASAHNITLLEVPQYGDPRMEARLVCHYESARGDPPLHSVKWYRENNEIFRFTPGQVVSLSCYVVLCVLVVTPLSAWTSSHHLHCRLMCLFLFFICLIVNASPRFLVLEKS